MQLKPIPTLFITNYDEAMEFYTGLLGFNLDWEHRPGPGEPVYLQVSKNGMELHLSENQRFNTRSTVFVETTGITELRKDILSRGFTSVPEITDTIWGTRQMEIEDPSGNLLRFNENL